MSTPNFYLRNMTRYYAIGMNAEEGEEDKMEWQLQDIAEELRSEGWEPLGRYYSVTSARGYTDSALGVAIREKTIDTPAGTIFLEVAVVVNFGYWEGACLDIMGRWEIGNLHYDAFTELTFEDIQEEHDVCEDREYWINSSHHREYLTDEKAAAACAKVKRVRDELREQAEAICARYADAVLRCRGVMCNGEAWYEAV